MKQFSIKKTTTIRNSLVSSTTGKEISGGWFTIEESRVTVAEDDRPVKPVPLQDTVMVIERAVNNTGRYRNGNWYGSITFVGGVAETKVIGDTANDMARVVNAALNNGASSGFNAGIALAELSDTCKTIANIINRLTDILHAVTLGRGKPLEDLLGRPLSRREMDRILRTPPSTRAANAFLEYNLAMRPLVNDIESALNAYHKGLLTRGTKVVGKAGIQPPKRDRRQLPTSPVRPVSNSGNTALSLSHQEPPSWGYDRNGQLASSARVSARVRNPTMASLSAMGLINPFAIAWEKVPLSFVIDYIVPIGPALQAMTAGAGLSAFRGSYISERREINTNKTVGAFIWSKSIITRRSIASSVLSMKQLLPTITQSTNHVLTAASLLLANNPRKTGL